MYICYLPAKGRSVWCKNCDPVIVLHHTDRPLAGVTGKFIDFPVCVIRNIFIRKLSHLTISSPFILVIKKCIKTTVAFE